MADSDSEYVVDIRAVHRHYHMGAEVVRALDGVDCRFARGSFWAIMGQSGSGKSTLLNLLGCLDRPDSGKYHLAGRDVSKLSDSDLSDIRLHHLGFIFQSFHLIPQLTVRENIELPLSYQRCDPRVAAERARALAADVGLEDRLDHRPNQLSGGQMQRVAIARALANDPTILLADEPTGNLDSRTGDQIMELLGRLNDNGMTILMVTHTHEIAARIPNHLLLKDGRVENVITAAEASC